MVEQLYAAKELPNNQCPIEIPTVAEALYGQTRKALAKEGFTFIAAIEPVSIGQLVTDEATSQYFGYVNTSENMRAIVPPQMEVAINPKNLRNRDSNFKSTDTQIRMIQEEEAALKGKLSQEVRDFISMRIQNASVLAQLDSKYHSKTRKVLFTNWFGRTDDQTRSPGFVASVGRHAPAHHLFVDDWVRGYGGGLLIFAFPVVVLPRKLAV